MTRARLAVLIPHPDGTVGVSVSTLTSYENGTTSPIYSGGMFLADHFDVSADYLGGLVDDPKAKYGGGRQG